MTVEEAVRRIMGVITPHSGQPAPAPLAGACRFCGDPVVVEITEQAGRVRVRADHATPLCPEFARAIEDCA